MAKKFLSLGSDGKLALRLSDGKTAPLPAPIAPNIAVLLIDTSSSMEGEKLTQAKSGASGFAKDAQAKGYRVGIIQFSSSASWLVEPGATRNTIEIGINGCVANGSTDMTGGIELAMSVLSQKAGLHAIVVVTDGQPNNSTTVLDAARKAKGNGVEIIAIGTDGADTDFLARLSSRSGLASNVMPAQLKQTIASAAGLLR